MFWDLWCTFVWLDECAILHLGLLSKWFDTPFIYYSLFVCPVVSQSLKYLLLKLWIQGF